MRLSIRMRPDRTIVAQARADDRSGIVGDAALEIAPAETVGGIPYEVWHAHAGTTVDLDVLREEAAAVPQR